MASTINSEGRTSDSLAASLPFSRSNRRNSIREAPRLAWWMPVYRVNGYRVYRRTREKKVLAATLRVSLLRMSPTCAKAGQILGTQTGVFDADVGTHSRPGGTRFPKDAHNELVAVLRYHFDEKTNAWSTMGFFDDATKVLREHGWRLTTDCILLGPAHTDDDLDAVTDAFTKSIREMKQHNLFVY